MDETDMNTILIFKCSKLMELYVKQIRAANAITKNNNLHRGRNYVETN